MFRGRFGAGQEPKKRACFRRGITAGELRRDPFRHSKNISAVPVDIFHQRFAAQQAARLRIVQPLRHHLLHIEMQNVGGAMMQVMQFSPHPQKKIVSRLDAASIPFAQPVFADQMSRGQAAFLEEGHPKQILIVAQAAAAAF